MKNKIFYFFILLLITNCGFTPMYDGGKKLDYNIIISSKEGDKLINNLISDEKPQQQQFQAANPGHHEINFVRNSCDGPNSIQKVRGHGRFCLVASLGF